MYNGVCNSFWLEYFFILFANSAEYFEGHVSEECFQFTALRLRGQSETPPPRHMAMNPGMSLLGFFIPLHRESQQKCDMTVEVSQGPSVFIIALACHRGRG